MGDVQLPAAMPLKKKGWRARDNVAGAVVQGHRRKHLAHFDFCLIQIYQTNLWKKIPLLCIDIYICLCVKVVWMADCTIPPPTPLHPLPR